MAEPLQLPHRLTLDARKSLIVTGVTEVLRFDDTAVALSTSMGELTVYGQGLQLRNLSLEGGQVAVEGTVAAMIYEQPRRGGLRRLLG